MIGTYVPLPTLDVVASCGGALAVAGMAYRLAIPRTNANPARGVAALHDSATYAVVAGAAGAFWLGGDALILLFAVVSALALADFIGEAPSASGNAFTACSYAAVPLQFGALAARRLDIALVVLPLVTLMVLPMVALAQGGTRHFFERTSERTWTVLAWVYCLSYVPALLLLDEPAFEERNRGVVVFVVAVTLAAQAIAPWHSAKSTRVWTVRVIALSALGAALAWMTPFSVPVAAALALVTAMAGWAGAFVLGTMRSQHAPHARSSGVLGRIALHLDALVFAAPVAFFVVRAGLSW